MVDGERLKAEIGWTEEWYETDDSGYVLCKTLAQFDSFCKDGGWKGSKDFFADTSVTRDELLGKWFMVVGGRVHIK